MNGGCYRIRNKVNGRCYFGHSLNLRDRWTKHLDRLKAGKHHNPDLQKDFDQYGRKAFVYEPLCATVDKHLGEIIENVFVCEETNKKRNPYNIYKRQEPNEGLEYSIYQITNESIKETN